MAEGKWRAISPASRWVRARGAFPAPAGRAPAPALGPWAGLLALLETRRAGSFRLAADLTLLACNPAGARLMARGGPPPTPPAAAFHFARPGDSRTLAARAARALAEGEAQAFPVGDMAEGNAFVCVLQPLRALGEPPVLLLVLHARSEAAFLSAGSLRDIFRLSPAEAAIALAFAAGRSVEEIAAQRGRSLATVRSQIRAVLRKTKCASMLEVALLITRLSL